MKEHSAICVRLFTVYFTVYEQSDLSYSLGPKDDARSVPIAPVELQSKFEDKKMCTVARTSHTVLN